MPEPKINVDHRWWDLEAEPAKLEKAATQWRDVGKDCDDVGTDINTAAQKVLDGRGQEWKGDTRDGYEAHKKDLVTSVSSTKGKAGKVASALEGIATVLRNRQGDLDGAKAKITGKVANVASGQQITFAPKDATETKLVKAAVKQAETIRSDAESQLSNYTDKFAKADWSTISTEWSSFVDGSGQSPFNVPDGPKQPDTIKLPDGRVIVYTGSGDDDTEVSTDSDGNTVVKFGDRQATIDEGSAVTIQGGKGDDDVEIAPGRDIADLTVLGGEGNDSVDDGMNGEDSGTSGSRTYIGGDGDDSLSVDSDNGAYISTGGGDDSVFTPNAHDISTGDGSDSVTASGGYQSGGRGDDELSANNGDSQSDGQIYGGEGADEMEGGSGDDTLVGGSGEDEIYGHDGDDAIQGGSGEDYMDGQDGNDVMSGGDDADTVYGLDGDDTIHGGDGEDYLEGGDGDDRIDGGSTNDVVSGGRGDDVLRGGQGGDRIYGGQGRDYADGGEGSDRAFIQDGDTTSGTTEDAEKVEIADNEFIQVDGSEEFKDRMRADLDFYSSSPTGRHMMEELGDEVSDTHDDWKPGEREVVIKEFDEDNGTASTGGGSWSDVNIEINPEFHLTDPGDSSVDGYRESPPSAVLYHELGHGYDYLNDTSADGEHEDPQHPDYGPDGSGVPKSERQAAGLPIDHDDDPSTPSIIDPDHPIEYTENGLMDEMGRGHRTSYGSPTK